MAVSFRMFGKARFLNIIARLGELGLILALLLQPARALAASSTPTNAPPPASTNVTAIAPAEIAVQAESTIANLHGIEAEALNDPSVKTIEQQLPAATDEVGARSEEDARILSHSTSLELFTRLQGAWEGVSEQLSSWNRTLTRRAKQLQGDATHVEQVRGTWELTRSAAQQSQLPAVLAQRIDQVLAESSNAVKDVQQQLVRVLTLQSRVTEQDSRITEAINALEQARTEILSHLLVRDSAPLWSRQWRTNGAQSVAIQSHHSLSRQARELRAYWVRRRERFILQLGIFVVLAWALTRARTELKMRSAGQSPEATHATGFGPPVAAALLIALLLSPWLYPQAPRLLWSSLGILALVPATLVLRRVLAPNLFGVLNALVALYLVDQLRSVVASQPLLWRLLFLAEMLAGAGYSFVLLRAGARQTQATRFSKVIRTGLRLALALFSLVAVANLLGYGRLSSFLGNALLSAAYLALVLYAAVRIADGLFATLLKLSPVGRLAVVEHHGGLITRWVERVLQWAASAAWVVFVLDRLALWRPLWGNLMAAVDTRLSIGTLSFSLGNILLFVVVIWAAFLVSRFLRFILEEEVYPHVHMAPGLHYSISKTLHYVILLVGFLLALAMLGFNLTKLTILAGAFGVGLGFGMQNIVNNFVSGIILLFERPIKVGDVIQLDSTEGVVRRIGIRASIVRTTNGSEMIVPNAKLISDPVTNWTFSQRRRLITLPVSVASDAEPKKVLELLERAAAAHPLVSKEKPVQSLLTNVNDGTANFELRAWTDQSEDWQQVRSDLFIAIKSALAAEKIALH